MLKENWRRGAEFLGTEHPIMGGAMSWISERKLVSAISNNGGFGVIACGSMSPELLNTEIEQTQKLTRNHFGVNLITMHPQLSELIDVCGKNKVTHVILAGGLPKSDIIARIKQFGAKVMAFAPALSIAKKLIRSGVDAIIIEGMEAGGHIGPVSTLVLAQEIIPYIKEVPIFVAGGIGSGQAVISFIKMGASGCQVGTKFVCATESIAHDKFKEVFIKSSARDAAVSVQLSEDFPVIPVRAINNNATKEFIEAQKLSIEKFQSGELSKLEAQLAIEHYWAGALRRAVIDGDVENGSVMAGQSVGMVNRIQPVAEIIQEFTADVLKEM